MTSRPPGGHGPPAGRDHQGDRPAPRAPPCHRRRTRRGLAGRDRACVTRTQQRWARRLSGPPACAGATAAERRRRASSSSRRPARRGRRRRSRRLVVVVAAVLGDPLVGAGAGGRKLPDGVVTAVAVDLHDGGEDRGPRAGRVVGPVQVEGDGAGRVRAAGQGRRVVDPLADEGVPRRLGGQRRASPAPRGRRRVSFASLHCGRDRGVVRRHRCRTRSTGRCRGRRREVARRGRSLAVDRDASGEHRLGGAVRRRSARTA